MPVVKIRPKGQITIPADILASWHLHVNDQINVNLVNGVVTLTPVNRTHKRSVLSYAGIARGLWGESAEDIDQFIRHERDSWEP